MNSNNGCHRCKYHEIGIHKCNAENNEIYDKWWIDNKNSTVAKTINNPDCFTSKKSTQPVKHKCSQCGKSINNKKRYVKKINNKRPGFCSLKCFYEFIS